jgi:hypothetical protein
MNLHRVNGTEHPTPQTVDILAEVSEFRTGRYLGGSPAIIRSLAQFAGNGGNGFVDISDERESMKRLAAHAIARIELLDKGKI